MGTKNAGSDLQSPSGLADALFTPVQQRVLALLFGQPERSFQSAEIIRRAGSGTGAAHRIIKRLAQSGLVTTRTEGNQKYYQANPDSPVFAELTGLVQKTVGLIAPIGEALAPFADAIRMAFIYGSVASGADRAQSDIDLMIITDKLDYPTLYEAVQQAENLLGRTINPTLMTPGEWKDKQAVSDSFVAKVRRRPRLFVIGKEDDLG